MKINKNILIAGAALLSFAACQTEMKQPTDAEIDAMVETKVNEVKTNLQQECDNSIMAMALAKADSTMVAMANKPGQTIVINKTVTTPTKKTSTTTTTKTEPAKPDPKPSNTNRPGSNQAGNAGNTSRPGADNNGTNKATEQPTNTNRPGADK